MNSIKSPVYVSKTVFRVFTSECFATPGQSVRLSSLECSIVVYDKKLDKKILFFVASIYGKEGYCIPSSTSDIIDYDETVHIPIYHITHYFTIQEMLTHSQSEIRALGLRFKGVEEYHE